MLWAFALALDNAGSNSAARIAMMAMTTRSSISVKPVNRVERRVTGEMRRGLARFVGASRRRDRAAVADTIDDQGAFTARSD
jgi:hypothetical protein